MKPMAPARWNASTQRSKRSKPKRGSPSPGEQLHEVQGRRQDDALAVLRHHPGEVGDERPPRLGERGDAVELLRVPLVGAEPVRDAQRALGGHLRRGHAQPERHPRELAALVPDDDRRTVEARRRVPRNVDRHPDGPRAVGLQGEGQVEQRVGVPAGGLTHELVVAGRRRCGSPRPRAPPRSAGCPRRAFPPGSRAGGTPQ